MKAVTEQALILERQFRGCSEKETWKKAIEEILVNDPTAPCGEPLDMETREEFFRRCRMDPYGKEDGGDSLMEKFQVKIPKGYLIVTAKGSENEYPGVYIRFSPNGTDESDMVACVEYDTCAEEIRTATCQKGYEEPIGITVYEDGRNLI